MIIALISCSKEKKPYPCAARELYSASALFSLSYQYARANADKVFILSAKYGLVSENKVMAPYDQTLNDMPRKQQLEWAHAVLTMLAHKCSIEDDDFILLAGSHYCRDIQNHLPHCSLPLAGMRMGERMAFLKSQLHTKESARQPDSQWVQTNWVTSSGEVSLCVRLHALFQKLPRYTWEQIQSLPFDNGIYIVYEAGELYHGMDRIVRVGTHTSPNRLIRRLTDHFVRENHNGSIFRKNIGKAVLNAHHDPYLPVWTLDTSKPENYKYIDPIKNADTEQRVSDYMRGHLTFTAFPVPDKGQRLRLEEAIISTLNHTSDFRPGEKWPGKYSPETEICTSGLWLKQGLDAEGLTESEFALLQRLCGLTVTAEPERSHTPVQKAQSSLGKYEPLYRYLCTQSSDTVTLSFSELEKILGFALPKSAGTYTMWWNPGGSHTQCQSWVQAGYKAVNVQQGILNKQMTFMKI